MSPFASQVLPQQALAGAQGWRCCSRLSGGWVSAPQESQGVGWWSRHTTDVILPSPSPHALTPGDGHLKVESLFLLFFKLPLCAWKDSASQGGNLGMQVLALHPEEPACNGEVTALQGQEWCWGLAQQAVAILGPADLGGQLHLPCQQLCEILLHTGFVKVCLTGYGRRFGGAGNDKGRVCCQ